MSRLVEFQLGLAPDHQKRLISEIWSLDSFWLEHTHDYIQWLFPIDTAGRFNQFAPLATTSVRLEFQNHPEPKLAMQRSFRLMTTFWGLDWDEKLTITPSSDLNAKKHIWLKRGGHNHLRISRVIRSLYLCDQEELATAFRNAVTQIGREYGYVGDDTFVHWQRACQ